MEILRHSAYWLLNIFVVSTTIYFFIKLHIIHKKLQVASNRNDTLQNLNDEVRCFKHDFDNIITTIGGYINFNDMQGLKEYYKNLECECKNINNLYLLSPKIINDSGVYNLLIKKIHKAKKLGINVSFEFLMDLKELKMNIYEFTRILGILLDNAIEAAKETTDKIIHLSFRNDFSKNCQIVVVENSYFNKNVNIDTIFDKSKTDKNNHSGLGLFEVRKILNRNKNLNLFTTKDNQLFCQQLEIYY